MFSPFASSSLLLIRLKHHIPAFALVVHCVVCACEIVALWTKALIDAFIFPPQQFSSFPEGFHSWMWKGLSFLLPFLYAAYIFQAYNAYTLFLLSRRPDCTEWQVVVLACIFFILSTGNTFTASHVVYQKFRGKLRDNIRKHLSKLQKDKNKTS